MRGKPLVPDGVVLPDVVVLGTDALLAALPATSAQLVRACGAAGFAAALPAVWGDEIIADATILHLARRSEEPAILCSCPLVTDRLLGHGAYLDRFLVSLEAPPVAAARYLRAKYGDSPIHVTYVGECPAAAAHPEIDAHLTPTELFDLLADRGIRISAQADGGDAPVSTRRFRSLPGGAPTAQALWTQNGRMLVELEAGDYSLELAQRLIARERALFDLAPRLGCVCSGVVNGSAPSSARAAVMATEPPRGHEEVLDPRIQVFVDRSIPSIKPSQPTLTPPESHPAYREAIARSVLRAAPSGGAMASSHRRHSRTTDGMRAIAVGRLPVTRTPAGGTLPRAYPGVRHRSITNGLVPERNDRRQVTDREREIPIEPAMFADSARRRLTPPSVTVPFPIGEAYRVPGPPSLNTSRLHAATFLAAIAAVVAVAVFALS